MITNQELTALIIAYRTGNTKAWGDLYVALQLIGMNVYSLSGFQRSVQFEDGQDIVLNKVEKLLNIFKTESIDTNRINLSFVRSSFQNAFRDRIRHDRNHEMVSLDEGFTAEDEAGDFQVESISIPEKSSTDDLTRLNNLKSHILNLLSTLGPKQAQVSALRFLENLSPEEIAEELGITTAQVYLNTCLAKKKLRRMLVKLGYSPE